MKLIKMHWPVMITVLVWVFCIVNFRNPGIGDTDSLGAGLLLFYILMPTCAFVASVWYGLKLRTNGKWIIVIIFGILEVLLITSGTGDWDFAYYWTMAFWGWIPSTVGMILGSLLATNQKK